MNYIKEKFADFEQELRRIEPSLPKPFADLSEKAVINCLSKAPRLSMTLDTAACATFWLTNGQHVYQIDEALAESLAATDTLTDVFDLPPRLPYKSIYLKFPASLQLGAASKTRVFEGVLLTYFENSSTVTDGPPKPAILVGILFNIPLAESDITGVMCISVLRQGDLLISPEFGDVASNDYITRLHRFVYNFLFVLQRTPGYLEFSRETTPAVSQIRRILGQKKRGFRTTPITQITLSKKAVAEREARALEEANLEETPEKPGVQRAAHFVAGHFHAYWVKDHGDSAYLDVKDTPNGKLYLVERWLLPYKRGNGDPVVKPKVLVH